MDLITRLQTIENAVFTPRAVYDGRKNMFAVRELPFGPTNSREVIISDPATPLLLTIFNQFDVSLSEPGVEPGARGPRVYKIKLTKVAEINTEYVSRLGSMLYPSPVRSHTITQGPQSLCRGSTVSRQHGFDCYHG